MPELSWEIESYPLEAMRKLLVRVLDSGGEFELSPKGTSMLPLLQEGRDSVILVKPPAVLSVGDVVLYQRENGAYVLHRIVGIDGETYTMCGDNQYQPEPGIRREQMIALSLTEEPFRPIRPKTKRTFDDTAAFACAVIAKPWNEEWKA